MSRAGAAACLLILLGATMRADAFEVTNCPSKPDSDLTTAARFLNRNMSDIVDQYTFLSEKQRQEIIRKWVGLNIHCSDSAGECVTADGYSHGGPGNRINIYYYSYPSATPIACRTPANPAPASATATATARPERSATNPLGRQISAAPSA